MSGESRDLAAEDPPPTAALSAAYAGIPFLVVPPSPVRVRRVSFSEDDVSFAEEDEDDFDGCHVRTPMLVVTKSLSSSLGAGSGSATAAVSSTGRQQSLPSSSALSGGSGDNETSRRRSRCKRQSSLQVGIITVYF